MKIYTRTGDSGKTSLFSGERVPKHHLRVDAYGEIDELNAVLGLLLSELPPELTETDLLLKAIQSQLLHLGAWLATRPNSPRIKALQPIRPEWTTALETAVDTMESSLEPLREFILPGGTVSAARSHLARTVCRRSERRMSQLMETEPAEGVVADNLNHAIVFLNRLSDYFFVLARFCNAAENRLDQTWSK